ncbi:MAG: UDP-N-acetylmuramoyl-L-alanine--D-glutamate ligase [Rickettsia endosymbiont of Ixodes persulcatus]|nr:UDP-N-acetylmuramoyl-L-alanine--D-glutamate ligase [Rickettsia endosymbiont of Ixodes persulcatus]MCZ6902828.1 UDP-N-acetylmuramoyl-L-alanine--D-glutamate ligase [Rickettsia endosymbiont of Ixodes persulcatus]MCZ6909014.1 UDP-N-acetylmuramoyl-L-alanine--D-glutamate ligase [Rickettsia endosymbiont of Ixodes persulcatus]MCZ6910678.1 UDP-N-acetylmuramoyl-L-alanine--D-glutamate ligase [Rickettsia endosymbiont of Ixodes persulcatus]MCZ6914208.1 UDP-N-acetylmuramoyl-L-alanine--D-glutamate ligase [
MNSHTKQKIGVFGLGKTGMSVYEELQNKYDVIVYDDLKANRDMFEELFGKNLIAALSDSKWQDLDKIVLSPGIPLTHEIVSIAHHFNISITSDIDLLFEKSRNLNFIAVTGTNGKSTTTALISHILNSNGLDYPVAGNIGVLALKAKNSKDGYILELSSFQLDLVKTFTAKIAVLLNITPDHLDRHKDMNGYITAKSKIFDRMDKNSYAVINIDNDCCREIFMTLQQEQRIKLIPFSVTKTLEKGILVVNDIINDNFFGNSTFKLPFNKNLQGIHNCENIAASYAVAKIMGLKPTKIIETISSFQSLPHRMQYIGSRNNISFYNDSKATNAISALQSIKALDNIYWLVGGIPKEGGIEEIRPYFNRIKKAYFYGQAKEMFADMVKNIVDFVICNDLRQAFDLAYKDAVGDNAEVKNILLAPSCSSYDQFKNFEERGELFIKLYLEKAKNKKNII